MNDDDNDDYYIKNRKCINNMLLRRHSFISSHAIIETLLYTIDMSYTGIYVTKGYIKGVDNVD